jgi:hypothetical protein
MGSGGRSLFQKDREKIGAVPASCVRSERQDAYRPLYGTVRIFENMILNAIMHRRTALGWNNPAAALYRFDDYVGPAGINYGRCGKCRL